jgi:uncharacterized protein (TIGR02391 family)
MAAIPKIDENSLQEICNVIAETNSGLSGSEIARLLSQAGIEDIDPTVTKRHRLFAALNSRQEKDNCANSIFAFIQRAMDPIRYSTNPELFESRRQQLNVILALRGYYLREDGQVQIVEKAKTLGEAQGRASRLHKELAQRNVHFQVLRYCKPELLQENYFHAVFEATKSIADRIREMTELAEDGAILVDRAFNTDHPLLAINSLRTETEISEQKGFTHLLKGVFGMFRNVTAHAPKIKWIILEDDALDLLALVSLTHKKLDKTVRTGLPKT